MLSATTCSAGAEPSDNNLDTNTFEYDLYSKTNYFDENDNAVLEAFMFLQDNREQIFSSPVEFLEDQGYSFLSSRVNHEIMRAFGKVPFLANTSLNLSFASGAAPAISLNSLLALKTFKGSNPALLNGIIFSQHRFEKAYKKDGSTINNGLGARFKVNINTVLGVNGFWDYRIMTSYTSHKQRV